MATPKRVKVGSRTSPLSHAQTEEVLRPLRLLYPDTEFEIVPITTVGDRSKSAPLLSMEKGMFVKDIEASLLGGEIDLAVHSAKDLTAELPRGLVLGAFGERQDPRDVLVNRWGAALAELPKGARLGTSSPRRTAQLRAARPDLQILPIRGNVGTRLEKARGDQFDGVVLAAAGVARLGRSEEISEYLEPEVCTPEVGQGALAVEARDDSVQVLDMVSRIDHIATSTTVRCERAFLLAIGGGCRVPVTAYARLDGGELHILAMAAIPDGSRVLRVSLIRKSAEPESAGQQAAEALEEEGAREIIAGATDQ